MRRYFAGLVIIALATFSCHGQLSQIHLSDFSIAEVSFDRSHESGQRYYQEFGTVYVAYKSTGIEFVEDGIKHQVWESAYLFFRKRIIGIPVGDLIVIGKYTKNTVLNSQGIQIAGVAPDPSIIGLSDEIKYGDLAPRIVVRMEDQLTNLDPYSNIYIDVSAKSLVVGDKW